MTVSRALNEPHLLKENTYKVVMDAVQELGYVSDLYAKKMRGAKSRTNTIGVLSLDTMTTPFSVELTLSIEETAREHGWNSFTVNMFENEDSNSVVDLLLAHRPDGIIYTAMGLKQVPIPERLQTLPCVLANCESIGSKLPTYIPNDEQGQYLGVKALLEKGHRNLLCIHLPKELLATNRRRSGLDLACREFGIDSDNLTHHYLPNGDEHHIDAEKIIAHYFDTRKHPFDAIVCGNDRVAFVVYQSLMSRGIKIPEDIAVLGYDNMVGTGTLFLPPLSTVQLPHYDIGRLSALHILKSLRHSETVHVDSPFLERCSI